MPRPDCKFSNEHYKECLILHAKGHTPTEIVKHFDEKSAEHPVLNGIIKICSADKNKDKIAHYRERYLADVSAEPIANKRIRLAARQRILTAIEKTLVNVVDKNGAVDKKAMRDFVVLTKRLEDILAGAQNEMEKRPQTVLFQSIRGGELTDEEIMKQNADILRRIDELRSTGISLPGRDVRSKLNDSPATPEGKSA